MIIHHLKRLLTELLVLGALVFYLAMAVAVLVGLTSWTWMASWLKHRRGKLSQKEQRQHPQKEQRQHPRYRVEFPARVSTDRTCGFGMISDLSVRGCKVKSRTTVVPGDCGKLLINLPTGITPVTVSLASVRWVKGHECGLEFILMDQDEQGCLNRTTAQHDSVVAVRS